MNFTQVKHVKFLKCSLHGKFFKADVFYSFDIVHLLCNTVLIFLILPDFFVKKELLFGTVKLLLWFFTPMQKKCHVHRLNECYPFPDTEQRNGIFYRLQKFASET